MAGRWLDVILRLVVPGGDGLSAKELAEENKEAAAWAGEEELEC